MDDFMESIDNCLIWEEIDLSAIKENIKRLKALISPETKFMAVVKADAYGHGSYQTAMAAVQGGADMLGVARIDEALLLRSRGIKVPILIFGFTPVSRVGELVENDLMTTVYSREMAEQFSRILEDVEKKLKIHIKLDTGMGRVGFPVLSKDDDSIPDMVRDLIKIRDLPGLAVEGIYTHFAMADSRDKTYTRQQFRLFSSALEKIRDAGISIPVKHCANSAAIIAFPETHLDLVRAGIAVYGLYPSGDISRDAIELKPALSLKSKIVYLKTVPPGFRVSYGCTFETPGRSVLATIPIGYADGYTRLFSSAGEMLVRGERAKVVGRVCMDQLMLDVTHIKDAAIGDEVVIIGTQGKETISADELADRMGTINYEIVSCFLPRVPKLFFCE